MKQSKKARTEGGTPKVGRYQEKRKLRLVPLNFSEECGGLLEAIRGGKPRTALEQKFKQRCAAGPGGELWV